MMKFSLRSMRSFLLGWFATVLALTISAVPISILFVLSQFSGNAEFPPDGTSETTCAIVFGSAVHEGREAGPGIRRRVDAAVDLFQQGKVQTLILSGGVGEGNTLSEAEVMRDEALKSGVPEDTLRLEKESTSTWENIKFAQPLAENCDSLVAISDRYHLARIRIAALRQNLDMMFYPAANPPSSLFEFKEILRESVGVLVYLVVRVP